MALRLIEMLIPEGSREEAKTISEKNELILDFWYDWISDNKISAKIIVRAEKSQKVLDELSEKFSKYEEFRLIVSPLDALIPRPPEEEKEKEKSETEETETASISREELYSALSDKSKFSADYLILISLSAIVASIGVLRNDWAVIIGAMVIAPMIGPNMGLSLSTTLADPELGAKSLVTIALGIAVAFLISVSIGFFLLVNPNLSFIISRAEARLADVALALSAGIAGAISFTRDVSTALIGVMVSISLLPTLVTAGLLLGSGNFLMAGNASLLFLINLTCINLSGVLTFLVEGIKPRSWWKANKAKRMSRLAMTIWIVLLSALIAVIIYTHWF